MNCATAFHKRFSPTSFTFSLIRPALGTTLNFAAHTDAHTRSFGPATHRTRPLPSKKKKTKLEYDWSARTAMPRPLTWASRLAQNRAAAIDALPVSVYPDVRVWTPDVRCCYCCCCFEALSMLQLSATRLYNLYLYNWLENDTYKNTMEINIPLVSLILLSRSAGCDA